MRSAIAFQCPYPGCNRKFNVNSNMRRHWRNHLTANRRRDAVARLVEPNMPVPPTPPLSFSPTSSPRSHSSHSLPSSHESAPDGYESRSPSPSSPYYSEESDGESTLHELALRRDDRGPSRSHAHPYSVERYSAPRHAEEPPLPSHVATTPGRMRSLSSPVPRQHAWINCPPDMRNRACTVPGCRGCPQVSTALRPAFPGAASSSSLPVFPTRPAHAAGPSH
jgi:hypothetical protein